MSEEKQVKKQLLKNMILNLVTFSIIFTILGIIIYGQFKSSLYISADSELEKTNTTVVSGFIFPGEFETIYVDMKENKIITKAEDPQTRLEIIKMYHYLNMITIIIENCMPVIFQIVNTVKLLLKCFYLIFTFNTF